MKIYEVAYDISIPVKNGKPVANPLTVFNEVYSRLRPVAYRRQGSIWYFTVDKLAFVQQAMDEAAKDLHEKFGATIDSLIYQIDNSEVEKIKSLIFNNSCKAAHDLLIKLVEKIKDLSSKVETLDKETTLKIKQKIYSTGREFNYIQDVFLLFELDSQPLKSVLQLFERTKKNFSAWKEIETELGIQ